MATLGERATRRENKRGGYNQKETDSMRRKERRRKRNRQASGPVGASGQLAPKATPKPNKRRRVSHRFERVGDGKKNLPIAKGPDLGDLIRKAFRNSVKGASDSANKLVGGLSSPGKANVKPSGGKILAAGPDLGDAGKKAIKRAGGDAATVLDTTQIPSQAIAGAAKAAVKGDNLVEGAKKGVKENTAFSDVLKAAGVDNKYIAAVAGLSLDVLADPTTYLTLGTAVPETVSAKIAAKAAGQQAFEKAIAKGVSKREAGAIGRKAAAKATKKAEKKIAKGQGEKIENKGLQVGARVHVPFTDKTFEKKTSGRATAGLARAFGISQGATAVRNSKAGQGVGEALLHDFRPAHRTPDEHATIREAERRRRAADLSDQRKIDRKTKAIKKASDDETIHRMERGETDDVIEGIKRDFDKMHEAEKSRGLIDKKFTPEEGPDGAKVYVPHTLDSVLKGTKKGKGEGVTITPSKAHKREVEGTIESINADPDAPNFSENLPAVYAHKASKSSRDVNLADMWDAVAKTGRKVEKGDKIHLADGEGIYRVTPRGIEKLDMSAKDAKAQLASIAKTGGEGGDGYRYLIFNDESIDAIKDKTANAIGKDKRTAIGKGFDKAQGTWKLVVTQPMPSYHVRNLIGDSINAFVGDATVKSGFDATKVLKARHARNSAERSADYVADGALPDDLNKTLKIGNKKITYGELLEEAEREGAIGGGFIGMAEELALERGKKVVGKFGQVKEQGGKALSRASQYREDLPRLATYISARRRGLSPSEAAEHTLEHHFDYGDITNFEVGARRAIPFWTFFARNTRLHATKVLTRPGKYATFGKVMNESAKAAGFDSYDGYLDGLKDYERRGLPVPVRWGGQVFNVQFAPPVTDLNQMTIDPAKQIQNVANRLTFAKVIGEMWANYSIFFQDQIQSDQSPRVKAPSLVGELPPEIQKALGVKMIRDRSSKSGKRVWGWYRKADYLARQLPETNFLIQQLMPGAGSRNQNKQQALVGAATGLKITPNNAADNKISKAFEDHDELDKRLMDLSQQGKKGTAAYKRIARRKKQLERFINTAERKKGIADPHYPQGGGSGLSGGLGGAGLAGGL